MFEKSPSECTNGSMSNIGFNSMHAASNRGNPMRDLSRMIINASKTSPNRQKEVSTANGERKSTFAAVGNSVSHFHRATITGTGKDTDNGAFPVLNRRLERSRPTSEERKINRPTTKHFFTLDNQERKR